MMVNNKSAHLLSIIALSVMGALSACSQAPQKQMQQNQSPVKSATHSTSVALSQAVQLSLPEQQGWQMQQGRGAGKPVVYQVFTRLFGNTNTNNIPWGTIEQNGIGKFADFTDIALQGIA